MPRYSGIVQSVEQRTVNPYVTGSSPVARAKISAEICGFFNIFHTTNFFHDMFSYVKNGLFFIKKHTSDIRTTCLKKREKIASTPSLPRH